MGQNCDVPDWVEDACCLWAVRFSTQQGKWRECVFSCEARMIVQTGYVELWWHELDEPSAVAPYALHDSTGDMQKCGKK